MTHHHTLIGRLIKEIRSLRSIIDEHREEAATREYYAEEAAREELARMELRLTQERRRHEDDRRRLEDEQSERESIRHEIETAQRHGDSYRLERAIRRMKNL